MTAIEYLNKTTNHAKKYREKALESVLHNGHMNQMEEDERIGQNTVDAILVDFINYMGMQMGCDYTLYTKDLKE